MFLTERIRGMFRMLKGRGRRISGAATGNRGRQMKGTVQEGAGRLQSDVSRAADRIAKPERRV